jgi:hypothetical protein
MVNERHAVARELGGRRTLGRVPTTDHDLCEAIREGFPPAVVETSMRALGAQSEAAYYQTVTEQWTSPTRFHVKFSRRNRLREVRICRPPFPSWLAKTSNLIPRKIRDGTGALATASACTWGTSRTKRHSRSYCHASNLYSIARRGIIGLTFWPGPDNVFADLVRSYKPAE